MSPAMTGPALNNAQRRAQPYIIHLCIWDILLFAKLAYHSCVYVCFLFFFNFVCVRHIQGRGSMGGSVRASEKCQWSPQRDKRHEQEIRSRKWIKDTQDKRGTERKKKLQNNTKTWQNDFKRPRSDVGCLCQTIQQGWEAFYMLRVIFSDK